MRQLAALQVCSRGSAPAPQPRKPESAPTAAAVSKAAVLPSREPGCGKEVNVYEKLAKLAQDGNLCEILPA